MEKIKNLALVAHDNRKVDLIDWVGRNYESIKHHKWICTGTTGALIEESHTFLQQFTKDKRNFFLKISSDKRF